MLGGWGNDLLVALIIKTLYFYSYSYSFVCKNVCHGGDTHVLSHVYLKVSENILCGENVDYVFLSHIETKQYQYFYKFNNNCHISLFFI